MRVLALGVHQPDMLDALCLRQVVCAQGEQDGFAVGRYMQVFYSPNAVKVFDGEGAFGGTAVDGQQQKVGYECEQSPVHEAPRLELRYRPTYTPPGRESLYKCAVSPNLEPCFEIP